jgi:hypothetical protein
MAFPGLIRANNLSDIADKEKAWDNLGIAISVPIFESGDDDVDIYINAVQNADNNILEPEIKVAISNFINGCKQDGIWPAIKACCILAGARTLAGALVPLVGTAPTNINFVSENYNRKTGLLGAGGKFLNSNRANNADPTNNNHNAVYMPAKTTVNEVSFISSSFTSGWNNIQVYSDGDCYVYSRNTGDTYAGSYSTTLPFLGISRSLSGSFNYRVRGTTITVARASQAANTVNLVLGAGVNGRLAFYSIGESLDLALLDARVTALINAFAAALP